MRAIPAVTSSASAARAAFRLRPARARPIACKLIAAVAERVGLSVESAGVNDEGRGRMLGLAELSTGQLVDLLAERMGSSIVVPNNRGGYAVPV